MLWTLNSPSPRVEMSTIVIYEQVHLDDLTYVKEEECFTFPCPCGDTFTFYVVRMPSVFDW